MDPFPLAAFPPPPVTEQEKAPETQVSAVLPEVLPPTIPEVGVQDAETPVDVGKRPVVSSPAGGGKRRRILKKKGVVWAPDFGKRPVYTDTSVLADRKFARHFLNSMVPDQDLMEIQTKSTEELCDVGFGDLLSGAFHLLALEGRRRRSVKDKKKEAQEAQDKSVTAEAEAAALRVRVETLEKDLRDIRDEADRKAKEWEEQQEQQAEELKKKDESTGQRIRELENELNTAKDSAADWEAKSHSRYQDGRKDGKAEVEDMYYTEMISHAGRAYQFGWDSALDAALVPSDSGLRRPVSLPDEFWLATADQPEKDSAENLAVLPNVDMATGEELRPLGYIPPQSPILVIDDDHMEGETQVGVSDVADKTADEEVTEMNVEE